MILQLVTDTTISANWVLTGAVSITCFLLARILFRLEKKQEAHELKLEEHSKDIAVLKERDYDGMVRDELLKAIKTISESPVVKYK